jgi:hypothetical protein
MSHDQHSTTGPPAGAAGAAGAAGDYRARVERQVRQRYAAELARADICESLQIEARIRAEVGRALAGGAADAGNPAGAENVTARPRAAG